MNSTLTTICNTETQLGIGTTENDFKEAKFVLDHSMNGACLWSKLDSFVSGGRNNMEPTQICNESYRSLNSYISPQAKRMHEVIQQSHDKYCKRKLCLNDDEISKDDIRKNCIEEIDKIIGNTKYSLEVAKELQTSIRSSVRSIIHKSRKSTDIDGNSDSEYVFPGEIDRSEKATDRKKSALDYGTSIKKRRKVKK